MTERGDDNTPPDAKSAMRFFELAAAQQHVRASFRLGVCLTGKNAVRAAQLLEHAAQARLSEAQYHLAACYGA